MQKQIILLIDDDEEEYIIFCQALQDIKSNFECCIAIGWQHAEKILASIVPDFIFLDYNMPGKNGIECLKEIRQKIQFQKVPVYLYSTGIDDCVCKKALTIGAADCIKKTSSIEELTKVLEPILLN